ncbi:unnamed protein product [Rhizophagus irregularis]|nr:unnamed protein product [Rhizophagus irregularis]CAB5208433.1 unnamed protein product [Rhizophagus irregularis]
MGSNSFNSKIIYTQPFSNHSSKSLQNSSRNNFISLPVTTTNHFTNFPVNKVMALPSPSVPKIIPILTSPDNQLVSNNSKYKEREHNDIKKYNQPVYNKERDIRTDNRIVSSKGKEREHTVIRNDYRLASSKGKEREHSDIDIDSQRVYNEAKNKEREHIDITESNIHNIFSSTTVQDDEEIDMEIDDNIPQPTVYFSNQLTETGHASNQAPSNKLTKTEHALNQAPLNKLPETGHVLNQVPVEQQFKPSVSFVEKVIRFLNSYNYEFDILNIMIDFSNKYQEIFQIDSVYLKPYHNNSCVLLHQLSIILFNRINSAKVYGPDFFKLEKLAAVFYEKLLNAEINHQKSVKTYLNPYCRNEFHPQDSRVWRKYNLRHDSNYVNINNKRKFNYLPEFSSGLPQRKIQRSDRMMKIEEMGTNIAPNHLNEVVFNQGIQQSSTTSPSNPNLPNNNGITDNIMERKCNKIMANAIQELAIASLAMKYNPEVTPGKLDNIVRKLSIRRVAKEYGSIVDYIKNLIGIFDSGGMDAVTKHLEERFFFRLKFQSKRQIKESLQNKQ